MLQARFVWGTAVVGALALWAPSALAQGWFDDDPQDEDSTDAAEDESAKESPRDFAEPPPGEAPVITVELDEDEELLDPPREPPDDEHGYHDHYHPDYDYDGATLGLQLRVIGGPLRLRGARMHRAAAFREPSLLRDRKLRVTGQGKTLGGDVQLAYISEDGVRWTLGAGMFSVEKLDVQPSAALPDGFSMKTRGSFGGQLSMSLGKELDLDGIRPYIDLEVIGGYAQTQVELYSDEHGLFGTTPYNAFGASFGPRVGVLLEIGEVGGLDLGVFQRFVGNFTERVFYAGLGLWAFDEL